MDEKPPLEGSEKWTAALTVRLVITLLVTVIVGFWLVMVAQRLHIAPVVSTDGTVIYDEFVRAKDILIAVLPLLTLALGYWFGAQGADKAEKKADEAEKKTKETEAQAKTLEDQVKAFYKVADQGVIAQAEAEVAG